MQIKSTASYLLITFFMAAIIISFAFTGFTGFSDSTGSIAQVGSQKVSIREYQRAYNAELQRFAQIFGGKPIENFSTLIPKDLAATMWPHSCTPTKIDSPRSSCPTITKVSIYLINSSALALVSLSVSIKSSNSGLRI